MFRRSPKPRNRTLNEELQAMCNASQLERLSVSAHLRRDIGVDCGCDRLPSTRPWTPGW